MDYFWLRQNREYLNTPAIEGFYQTMRRKDFRPETAFKIPEKNVVFCSSQKSLDFLDILDRVYVADIKKLVSWYNILISNGITEFKQEETKEDEKEATAE